LDPFWWVFKITFEALKYVVDWPVLVIFKGNTCGQTSLEVLAK